MARSRDTVAPPLHVVHLDDDLHPQAPAEGRYIPTEVAALLRELGHRPYAQDDVPQAEAGVVAGLVARELEGQHPGVEGYARLHVQGEELQAQPRLIPHIRASPPYPSRSPR